MSSYQVDVSKKEWLFIIAIGTLFGYFFGIFTTYVLQAEVDFSVAFVGGVIGLCITVLAAGIIPILNSVVIPNKGFVLSHILGASFSFLSGFLGFLGGYTFLRICCDERIEFIKEPLIVAIAVGVLSYLFGVILYFFHFHKAKQQKLETVLAKERVNTLESQLNPHFVHNTLNVLAELVHYDAKRAEKGILLLSKLLRTIVDEKAEISVAKELQYIERYIEIVSLQHSDLIEVAIDAKQDLSVRIPKFSIQLLVENAIKYGFVAKKFTIEISVEKKADRVFVTVSNRGNEIKDLKFGVGLYNLQSRVQLLCKENTVAYRHENGKNSFIITLKEKS